MNCIKSVLNFSIELVGILSFAIGEGFKFLFHCIFPKRKNISGQVVLITGAGSGIGRLLAARFADLGCNLVLWDINKQGNEQTAVQCRARGVQAYTYTVDISSREKIYEAANKVAAEVGTVSILVNNAGIVTGKSLFECKDEDMIRTMDINTLAHFWTTKAFVPKMISDRKGHIISIASSAGLVGVNGLADYCASKFGAVGFNESLRRELIKLGVNDTVKTLVVCPFFINTGMFDGVKTKYSFLLPILQPDYVADKIIAATLADEPYLALPRFIYTIPLLQLLPISVQDMCAKWLGISSSMDEFVGRSGGKAKGH